MDETKEDIVMLKNATVYKLSSTTSDKYCYYASTSSNIKDITRALTRILKRWSQLDDEEKKQRTMRPEHIFCGEDFSMEVYEMPDQLTTRCELKEYVMALNNEIKGILHRRTSRWDSNLEKYVHTEYGLDLARQHIREKYARIKDTEQGKLYREKASERSHQKRVDNGIKPKGRPRVNL